MIKRAWCESARPFSTFPSLLHRPLHSRITPSTALPPQPKRIFPASTVRLCTRNCANTPSATPATLTSPLAITA
eukprot:3832361-Pleurochrysis_carterae.AAC.2